MSKSRHTEAQMIGALKQLVAGRRAEDVARKVGVSKHTIYAWKATYGGMDVSQAQEAKQLREENTQLRKLVKEARRKIAAWRTEYNRERPHSSLGYRTPEEFAREIGGEEGYGKDAAWKSRNCDFTSPLGNPAEAARFPLSHSHGGDGRSASDAVSNPDVVV